MRNGALYAAGLVMGAANTIRHKRQGYVSPRPFDPADVDRTLDHAEEIVDRLQSRGEIDWTGKRVLELGPGSDLTTGAIMLARGTSSYMAVDLFDNRGQAHPALYERLGERIGQPVDPDRLGFTLGTFPDLPELADGYDVIVSNATLEHIEDMDRLLKALRRVAAPGARMVHHIDGQTHMRWIKDRDPLNILRYPDAIYDRFLSFPGAPNRLRSSDYERLAVAAGWSPTTVPGRAASTSYVESFRPAKRFHGYRDLNLLTFTLVAAPN